MIDHVKQGRAELPEPASVEGADYEQDQGKAPLHLTAILEFILPILFMILGCALRYRS
jgi:hypothetical protein